MFSRRLSSQLWIVHFTGKSNTLLLAQSPIFRDNMFERINIFLHKFEVSPPTNFNLPELLNSFRKS